MEDKLEEWRRTVLDDGLRVSIAKTEYMRFGGDDNNGDVRLLHKKLARTGEFFVIVKRDLDREITHKVCCVIRKVERT